MHPYFLALPLPENIRSRLTSFCYGLPQVRWMEEENFYLTLRSFGPLPDSTATTIRHHLQNLFFQSFSLVLEGIGHFHFKGSRGIIWIGIANNDSLILLRKEIDRHLRELKLPSEEHLFHPHITLGHYEHLSSQRLADYLAMHADYQSLPIEVSSCLLLRSLNTPKRVIYEMIEEYPSSQLATGED